MSKYKVGDKVKVRTWEDLSSNYDVVTISDNPNYNVQKIINKGCGFIYPVIRSTEKD